MKQEEDDAADAAEETTVDLYVQQFEKDTETDKYPHNGLILSGKTKGNVKANEDNIDGVDGKHVTYDYKGISMVKLLKYIYIQVTGLAKVCFFMCVYKPVGCVRELVMNEGVTCDACEYAISCFLRVYTNYPPHKYILSIPIRIHAHIHTHIHTTTSLSVFPSTLNAMKFHFA